ncbi:hypothetical protein U9M48_033978 [Paspalum notatum var. saurae]|uniref:Reverse transcriptase zinc-binding domain-containing protein n=1 Tax=Paspalum notatum var. saurae TaxID=547442 RepID=A0AAQ3U9V1_PASNO
MILFGCKAGNLSINYLGIPIHFRKLRNCDWVKVEEHFEKRLSSWKGKHLSIGGRLTLINTGSLKSWITSARDSFGRGMKTKGNTDFAKWAILCQPKDQGALNIALLSKWLYKLLTLDGLWQQMLRNKYVGSKPLAQVEWKLGDSHFWSCLMRVKPDFFRFGTFLVKDGSQARFWEDTWLDGTPLKDQYPSLYNIARFKFISIAEAMSASPPNFSWRRQLFGTNLDNWLSLLSRIDGLELSQDQDTFLWNLTPNGRFSVKSHYAALMIRNVPNGVTLTKDNLAKRNWQGSLTCASCHKEEIINHLFFECRLARSVWSILQMTTGINQPQSYPYGDTVAF